MTKRRRELPQRAQRDLQEQDHDAQLEGSSVTAQIFAQAHAGPLPPPAMLRDFDLVIPGLGERIVKMAELNQEDRLKNNRANRWLAIVGQLFAFVLAITAVGGAIYLAMHDKSAAAVAAVLGGLGIPLAVFVVKRQKQPPS